MILQFYEFTSKASTNENIDRISSDIALWSACYMVEYQIKKNQFHEGYLQIVDKDYTSSFEDLPRKDQSLTVYHRNR